MNIRDRHDPLAKDAGRVQLWLDDERRGGFAVEDGRATDEERCGGQGGGEGEVGDYAEEGEDEEGGWATD